MSLRDKTARWIFDARWSQMPDDEVAVHINNTILDAAINAVKTLGSYDEETIIKVIEALKEGLGD